MKAQYAMFVDAVVSKKVCVSIICMTSSYITHNFVKLN
jgi:hypothetical protein